MRDTQMLKDTHADVIRHSNFKGEGVTNVL